MAFSAIAALATATTVTVPMVLAAMAQVGTIMSVVGVVTGNKDLVKLGGAIGLVGGIGGLVAGAAGAATGVAARNVAQETVMSSEIAAQNAGAGIVDTAATVAPEAAASAALPSVDGAVADPGFAPPPNTTPLPTDVAGVAAPAGPAGAVTPGDVGARFATKPAVAGSAKGSGFFSGVFDYIKDPANKEIVNMGQKVIGGAFEGMQRADEFDRTQGLRENEFAYRQAQDANVRQQNTSRSGIIQRVRA